MTSSLALHLRPRRVAALALAALAACGGDASDPTGPPPTAARLSEVRVSPSTIELALGSATKLSATPRDANGRPMGGVSVSWRSLDPGIASVDAAGNVTAGALGTARIEARAETFTDTADVIVKTTTTPSTGVATLSVDPGRMSLRPGTTGTLTAILRDAQNEPVTGEITWTSGNESVVRVNSSGVVTAVALGETDIVASIGGLTAFVEITVGEAPPPPAPVSRVSVSPAGGSVAVGAELLLAATPQDASGNRVPGRVVTWTSSNPAVATVSAGGAVRGASAGTVNITARVDNVTQSVSVTVTPAPTTPVVATVAISPTSVSLQVGGTRQLTATARDAGGAAIPGAVITWSGGSGAIASVSPSGLVTAHGAGTVSITATSAGRSATVQVTVAAAPVNQQTVTLTPTERGTIERDGDGDWALPFVLFVGDDDEFEIGVRQAFVLYSIANIPANAQIQSAQVGVTMDAAGVVGSPFSLGGLYVERAPSLQLSTAAPAGSAVLVASSFTAAPVTNVTDLVRAARQAGESTIILRFRFSTSGNDDGVSDYLELGPGVLSVTFTQ